MRLHVRLHPRHLPVGGCLGLRPGERLRLAGENIAELGRKGRLLQRLRFLHPVGTKDGFDQRGYALLADPAPEVRVRTPRRRPVDRQRGRNLLACIILGVCTVQRDGDRAGSAVGDPGLLGGRRQGAECRKPASRRLFALPALVERLAEGDQLGPEGHVGHIGVDRRPPRRIDPIPS